MKPILAVALAFSLSAIADEYPPATDHIADCENRWILLQGKDPGTRILAFAYVDPEAGVTINVSGEVAFGEDGALVRKPWALQGSGRVIARVTSNYEVICLTVAQVANLGVPPLPDWLKFYEGIGGELGPHNASWASHYNHIGAFAKALELIQAAISVGFSSPGLHFEHAFALNALRRFEEAATVSKAAVMEHPDNVELLAELAYSYLKLND